MSTTPQQTSEGSQPTAGSSVPRWLLAVVAVFGLVLIYVAYAQYSGLKQVNTQLQQMNDHLAKLDARSATLEENYANVKSELDVTSQKLGLTQEELAKARASAQKAIAEQRRASEQLGTQVKEHETQLGTVKTDVATTRQELQQTQAKLESAVGDLGVQSGLIARNSEEVQELKRRGERDYVEFNLKRSKEFTRVGVVSIRLNKVDTKRSKFTLTVLANDRKIEKKDKTLLEPVQFYMAGTRHLLEIVVYQVDKDRVVGYLSAPKDLASR